MKRLILIFTLLSQWAFAQNNFNFSIQNNQIEWLKVYETNLSRNDIETILKTNGIFKNLRFSENSVIGEIENISADYKGAGSTAMLTSFYIQNSTIAGQFQLEFKEGKYRATLNGIILKTISEIR